MFLFRSLRSAILPWCTLMSLPSRICPTSPTRLAYALRFQGGKRVHNADKIMAEIVGKRLVEHLERAGFVVMKRPTDVGAAALGRGFEG